MHEKTIIERAFELAQSGECRTLFDIKQILHAEQFSSVDAHMSAPTLRKQLQRLMSSLSLPRSEQGKC